MEFFTHSTGKPNGFRQLVLVRRLKKDKVVPSNQTVRLLLDSGANRI
jgi:hypothetical protein